MRAEPETSALCADDVRDLAHMCHAVYGKAPDADGWEALSCADLGLDGLDPGPYVNRNALAFVRECWDSGERVLALVFRGTDPHSLADWRDNILGLQRHYALLRPLVAAVDAYAAQHGIHRVIAAGHSLGGAMAELYVAEHRDGAIRYSGCTFGSPGAPVRPGLKDQRIAEFRQAGDLVPWLGSLHPLAAYHVPGQVITLPAAAPTGGFRPLAAHSMAGYLQTIEALWEDGDLAEVLDGHGSDSASLPSGRRQDSNRMALSL